MKPANEHINYNLMPKIWNEKFQTFAFYIIRHFNRVIFHCYLTIKYVQCVKSEPISICQSNYQRVPISGLMKICLLK